MKKLMVFLCAMVLLFVGAVGIEATPMPLVEWNDPTTDYLESGDFTVGFAFTTDIVQNVVALGVYDRGIGFGGVSRSVSIWEDNTQLLLATTTVSDNDAVNPLEGHFRYQDIAPVTLEVGKTYVVGANSSNDYIAYNNSLIKAAGINFSEDRFASGSAFPDISIGFEGWFGANAKAVAPVPEPATMLLLGTGLIGLTGFGRKKLFKKKG
ncbi:hypothetical protein D1AOALGA4SA_950 [Olavius algarvensis Delta 1 endosymbiont]|nr:hypothetical protein D1AOALGA4SA_950 [Olavius algarvensis Delta 1 endosymbiont]